MVILENGSKQGSKKPVVIKGKEKKTRSKRERECKYGKNRKHGKSTILSTLLWLVEKQTKEESRN